MRKSQIVLVLAAVAAVIVLYAYGRTSSDKKLAPAPASQDSGTDMSEAAVAPISFDSLLDRAKSELPAARLMEVTELEHSVVRGDIRDQQLAAFRQLAGLWDSLGNPDLQAFYLGSAALLENSQKSLTFAADLFLNLTQRTNDPAVRKWESDQAEKLLNKALILNPGDDTIQIGLADARVEGGDVMNGVQALLEIVKKHPDNPDANLILGRLSVRSGQYAKAIGRLRTVISREPGNAEALYFLAVSYQETGNNQEAIKYFQQCRLLVDDPEFKREIDSLVNALK